MYQSEEEKSTMILQNIFHKEMTITTSKCLLSNEKTYKNTNFTKFRKYEHIPKFGLLLIHNPSYLYYPMDILDHFSTIYQYNFYGKHAHMAVPLQSAQPLHHEGILYIYDDFPSSKKKGVKFILFTKILHYSLSKI